MELGLERVKELEMELGVERVEEREMELGVRSLGFRWFHRVG